MNPCTAQKACTEHSKSMFGVCSNKECSAACNAGECTHTCLKRSSMHVQRELEKQSEQQHHAEMLLHMLLLAVAAVQLQVQATATPVCMYATEPMVMQCSTASMRSAQGTQSCYFLQCPHKATQRNKHTTAKRPRCC
eukprot:GHRQ01028903.1.p1 GENE.GHRQ01028903.1~~GHRQ01028903.1.p1  ORF type:complete len:137 (-),score=16.06 GHRQ01028903.1:191-601(-)